MKIYNNTFSLNTSKKFEIINISNKVSDIIVDSGIENGLINIWTTHTTATLIVNENDTALWEDILFTLSRLIPLRADYSHDDKYRDFSREQNTYAHILNCLIKPNITAPLKNGIITLGKWQSFLFVELDGPRTRSVSLQIIGE